MKSKSLVYFLSIFALVSNQALAQFEFFPSCPAQAKTYKKFLDRDGLTPNESYKLVFDDEFNGNSIDATKWATYYYKDSPGDDRTRASYGELSYYDDNNVVVQNGVVKLISEKVPTFTYRGILRNYKTGMLYSKQTTGFQFGKFEMRCKLPRSSDGWIGSGYKPAFWLIGGCYGRDEIDVFEMEGRSPNELVTTLHKQVDCTSTSGGNGDNNCYWYRAKNITDNDIINGFHIYSVEWTPDCITWYLDGRVIHTYGGWFTSTGADAGCPPYASGVYERKPLFLEDYGLDIIANLQLIPGAGDPSLATYPNSMDIDYIRVYQRTSDNSKNLCKVGVNGPSSLQGSSSITTDEATYTLSTNQPYSNLQWTLPSDLIEMSRTSNSITVRARPGAQYTTYMAQTTFT